VSSSRGSSFGRLARRVGLSLAFAGLDPRATARTVRSIPRFCTDLRTFRRLSQEQGAPPPRWIDVLPALADRTDQAGGASNEYFLADLWTAQRIWRAGPVRHVDVGSRIDGLVAHLLTFRDVEVVDIRPLRSETKGLEFLQADATSLSSIETASLPSVSSVHALEHFGLGRYGDTLDPDGHVRGIEALGRVTAPGGDLYIGVPVGIPTVEYNAHRVLPVDLVGELLDGFELVEFAAAFDGRLHEHLAPADVAGLRYSCGLYHLRAPGSAAGSHR
jgi:hypothetical protein